MGTGQNALYRSGALHKTPLRADDGNRTRQPPRSDATENQPLRHDTSERLLTLRTTARAKRVTDPRRGISAAREQHQDTESYFNWIGRGRFFGVLIPPGRSVCRLRDIEHRPLLPFLDYSTTRLTSHARLVQSCDWTAVTTVGLTEAPGAKDRELLTEFGDFTPRRVDARNTVFNGRNR